MPRCMYAAVAAEGCFTLRCQSRTKQAHDVQANYERIAFQSCERCLFAATFGAGSVVSVLCANCRTTAPTAKAAPPATG
jgi:hypothetical protein